MILCSICSFITIAFIPGITLLYLITAFYLSCRKDQNVLSPVNCWNLLLNQVKRESRDHTTLSDIYLNNIIPRFVQVSEDSGRLFKKVIILFHLVMALLLCTRRHIPFLLLSPTQTDLSWTLKVFLLSITKKICAS